jgi:DNA-binding NtrC family response regulator
MSVLSFVIPSEAMPPRSARSSSASPTTRDGDAREGRAPTGSAPSGESGDRRSVLMALLELVRTEVDLDSLLRRVVDLVAQAMSADRATLFLIDKSTSELVSRAAHLPELPEIRLPAGQGIAGHVWQTRRPIAASNADDHPRFAASIDRITGYKTVTVLAAPVLAPLSPGGEPEVLGVLQVLNKKAGLFDDRDRELLCELASEVATALSETALHERVTGQAPERYHRIVGSSPLMRRVYEIIARAAATSATVLLRGESGTGKELAARAVHYNSSRARGPFVKIDCTAIPEGLMESELFGHERGAFTGAEQRVLGKAELAHGGTLFLDEIGDLKPSLQGKLLRLLQDREFERVGGRKTIAVDLRIIAATNCDLAAMAEAKTFRTDLYYRLKVIELLLPSLRERGGEDIERLALHFAELYARRHKKPQRGLSAGALRRLRSHTWPGNIRELEHCIESAVALCGGDQISELDLPLPVVLPLGPAPTAAEAAATEPGARALPEPPLPTPTPRTTIATGDAAASPERGAAGLHLPDGLSLEDVEARYVAHTIARCGGNRSEAARILGIGRNTLLRKLKEPGSPS